MAADNFTVPEPKPLGRVKLRVRPVHSSQKSEVQVWHRNREYYAGDTFRRLAPPPPKPVMAVKRPGNHPLRDVLDLEIRVR